MTSSPEALEALARAYDREDAAQRGEPDPWDYDDGNEAETLWRAERIACAQVGIAAYLASSPEGRQEAAVLDAIKEMKWFDRRGGLAIGMHEALRRWIAALQAPATPNALPASKAVALDVDALAQEIRRVDGKHDLGAGQLAEALMPFLIASALPASKEAEEVAKPIGYMREKDNDGTAFWVSKAKNSYYGKPLYAHPPTDAGVSEASYQEIFNAIAAATKIEAGAISISVKDFRAALSTAIPAGDGVPLGMDGHACPICAILFQPNDICATDIELGSCHAACLEGSPTVDLETGEPVDGPIPTYPYNGDKP